MPRGRLPLGFHSKLETRNSKLHNPPVEPKPPAPPRTPPPADPMLFCPNCSAKMRESRCKLKCDICGFFLSCSDFY
jgi:hypothetical protein